MRVKTVPRHMIVQNDLSATSSSENANSMNSIENNREENVISSNTLRMKDVSELRESNETFFVDAVAGPSTCQCFKWYTIEKTTKPFPIVDEKNDLEVIDLSIRDCNLQSVGNVKGNENEDMDDGLENNTDDDPAYSSSIDPDDKLKDTFLYKIMTDPTFLENIQKNKQQQQQQQQQQQLQLQQQQQQQHFHEEQQQQRQQQQQQQQQQHFPQQLKKPICPFCHDEFSNYFVLSEHMDGKIDETTAQIVCCVCKKNFARKRYLRYHQKCHLERTKFTCDICTKKYTRLDNLTRHNTFHVNPDKFPCTSCEKTFARKDLLNKHLKCHENRHRYYCEDCDKYFKGQVTLDNHKKFHHADVDKF